ncbi:MAG: biopolymer transporter ExbD [Pseudomonadota bacterium]
MGAVTAPALRKSLPRSRRRYGFALTPLADAMFQLLIFFMLSSSLTPFSLITIKGGAVLEETANPAEVAESNDDVDAVDTAEAAVWVIERGEVIAGRQRFGFDRLDELSETLRLVGTTEVLIVARPIAEVQDVVRVLEALATAGVTSVQVVTAEGA